MAKNTIETKELQTMNIFKKLFYMQQELKAPKMQINKFGNYNYRSCEDILEALKPLLSKYHVMLFFKDEITKIDNEYLEYSENIDKETKQKIIQKIESKNRIYLKTTVTLVDIETGEKIETEAIAREEEKKKGMDGSQITGSSSSYARKYALNALFAIDDNKDSDFTNKHGKNDSNIDEEKKKIETERKTLANLAKELERKKRIMELEQKKIEQIKKINNIDELKKFYSENKELKKEKLFNDAISKRKIEIEKNVGTGEKTEIINELKNNIKKIEEKEVV